MARAVPLSDGRDAQQIQLDGSNDVWMLRDAKGSGYIVVADAITVAIGEPTPEAAVIAARAYMQTPEFAAARDELRRRVQ